MAIEPWTSGRLTLPAGRRQPRDGLVGISAAIVNDFESSKTRTIIQASLEDGKPPIYSSMIGQNPIIVRANNPTIFGVLADFGGGWACRFGLRAIEMRLHAS